MRLGHRLHKIKRIGHRSLHKVTLGSRLVQQGGNVTSKILMKTGRATGNPELVAAGQTVGRGARLAGKVSRTSARLEKVI